MNPGNAENFLRAYGTAPRQDGPDWLRAMQDMAVHKIKARGLPVRGREDWRYTDIGPICRTPWRAPPALPPDMSAMKAKLEPLRFAELDCLELCFVNGQYAAALSNSAPTAADDVLISPLQQAAQTHADVLQGQLGDCLERDYDFAALNTAFITQGGVVRVPDQVRLSRPVHLFFLTTETADTHFAFHPRNLFLLGKDSSATIIESYIGLDDGDRYFNNAVSEAKLADGANLQHYRIQQESLQAHHIGHLCARQGRDSTLSSHCIALGAALARTDLHSQLHSPGAEARLNGLYLAAGKQHTDHHIHVEHSAPRTRSRVHYRGVLNDRGHGVFNGKVLVHPGAQKIDSHQMNANLLLSDQAEIDTLPELEIYADDVKCGHGATVAQLDEDMLFYLRSRAMDENTARSLLNLAFAETVISQLELEPLRHRLSSLILGWMPHTELLRQFAP